MNERGKTNNNLLKGKVSIVTGGGKGIGRSIAFCLGEEGSNVVVVSRTISEIERVSKQIIKLGGSSMAVQANIADENDVKSIFRKTIDRWGTVDILVNNAAIFGKGFVVNLERKVWVEILATNLTGTFLCCKAALPYMIKHNWGRIINISSSYGKMPRIGNSAYNTSKLGLIGFTRCLALETADQGITVNSICPGWVETEQVWRFIDSQSNETGESKEILIKRLKKESPQNKWINPKEIGRLVVYLASNDAASITGEDINMSGGMVMY